MYGIHLVLVTPRPHLGPTFILVSEANGYHKKLIEQHQSFLKAKQDNEVPMPGRVGVQWGSSWGPFGFQVFGFNGSYSQNGNTLVELYDNQCIYRWISPVINILITMLYQYITQISPLPVINTTVLPSLLGSDGVSGFFDGKESTIAMRRWDLSNVDGMGRKKSRIDWFRRR